MSYVDRNTFIEIQNFYQLFIKYKKKDEGAQYAYYIYKDDNVHDKIFYSDKCEVKYNLIEKGKYKVKIFIKNSDMITTEYTDTVEFNGFDDVRNEVDNRYIICGVSKESAFIKKVLDKKYHDVYVADITGKYVNKKFFGSFIKDIDSIDKNGCTIIITDYRDLNKWKLRNYKKEVFNYKLDFNSCILDVMNSLDAIILYKLAKECYEDGLVDGANFIKSFILFKCNSYIPYTAEIGEGTKLGYGGIGVVIHWKSKIGKNCKISQNVTIGSRGPLPEIGDNVFIGPGTKCIGGKIGSNVIIGANSVVTKEIPDNCVVAGVPAKIISRDIEKYKRYFNTKR